VDEHELHRACILGAGPPRVTTESADFVPLHFRVMHETVQANKAARLFLVLGAFFITNALLAEFIGVKIFSLEGTLGVAPARLELLGDEPLDFNLTAGVVLWPFVFVMTDLINEYFGPRGVRLLSLLGAGMIAYAFLMVFLAMRLAPAGFWATRADGFDMDAAFRAIFGQGNWIIAGSLTAFLVGQLVDVFVFQRIKRATGERWIFLRSTGSTLVSQLVDSFVVLYVAFGLGAGWPASLIVSVGVVNYLYKSLMALVMTPLIYAIHGLIERYLGAELAGEMRRAAMRA
jgi:uncharacterized integral membrane protein (TIGR00697 family)